MADRNESLKKLKRFADEVSPTVQKHVRRRDASMRQSGYVKEKVGQHCRGAVFSVDDETLKRHGVIRVGAHIKTKDYRFSHSYFSLESDRNVILDFCASFVAFVFGDSINNWRRKNPDLFHGKHLLANKDDIKQRFDVGYPKRDLPFWDHFNEEKKHR